MFIACSDQAGKQRRKLVHAIGVEMEYVIRSQRRKLEM